MNKLSSILSIIFLLTGCRKDVEKSVFVRIQNTTQTSFSYISVANSTYGNISSATTSGYKLISQPIYTPGCVATIIDSSFYIGYLICGTPMPPAFQNGKYTFIIKQSILNPGYYNLEMKKDE